MNDIVRWDEELARDAKEVAKLERPAVSAISLRAGVMQYRNQQIPGNKLATIILASCVERRYDTEAFDPDNIRPPACFALSLTGQDMVPHDASPEKQADACDGCPQNQWQPNPKKAGKNYKPCKERRRMALIAVDQVKAGTSSSAELAMLSIPVTSVKHWAVYVNRLSAEFKRPPWAMVTEVAVTPHVQSQFEVKFQPVEMLDDEFLAAVRARVVSGQDAILTPYDASGYMVPSDAPQKDKPARKF